MKRRLEKVVEAAELAEAGALEGGPDFADNLVVEPQEVTMPSAKSDWLMMDLKSGDDGLNGVMAGATGGTDPWKTFTRGPSVAVLAKQKSDEARKVIRASRELNPSFKHGARVDIVEEDAQPSSSSSSSSKTAPFTFGDKGSSWRMMKLKRVFDIATESQLNVKEVATDRLGSLESFEQHLAERAFLNGKGAQRDPNAGHRPQHQKSTLDQDAPKKAFVGQGGNFKRPSGPSPISSAARAPPIVSQAITNPRPAIPEVTVMSLNELNQLNAKIMKAKLMGASNAQQLEKEYTKAKELYEASQMIQSNPAQSFVATASALVQSTVVPKNAPSSSSSWKDRKREFHETHDKAGNRLRYAGQAETSLQDMVDHERRAKLSTSHAVSSALRHVSGATTGAVSHSAAAKCSLCEVKYSVAEGNFTYLTPCPTAPLLPGHCQIVPFAHLPSSLEGEEDTWDEVRNFMKSLFKMCVKEGKGLVCFERSAFVKPTGVVSFRKAGPHTYIECIPVPLDLWQDAPAFFKEAILHYSEEWSTHKKVIETSSAKPFRTSFHPNFPYFHVWFEPNRGLGHIIDGEERWPEWFGREVLSGQLDLGPELWRKPRRLNGTEMKKAQEELALQFDPFDWTRQHE